MQLKVNSFTIEKWIILVRFFKVEIGENTLLGNFYAITKREYFVHYDDLRQPKDKDEWGFSPAEVNAFYDPETNQICMIININILH